MKISTLSATIITIIASAFNSYSLAAPASAGNVNNAVANLPQARTINSNWGLYDNNQLIQQQYKVQAEETGHPAWAQSNYNNEEQGAILPFGASLFKGHFANTYSDSNNPDYRIGPGDRIVLRIWGAKQYDDVLAVDQQGNIFIPEVGPINVRGITNAQLQQAVKNKISSTFTSNIEVYLNLQSSQPIGVFVTGFVTNPGQYAGGAYDSLLAFIDRAGGIDFSRGSFRNIKVKRDGKVIATFDLYDFLFNGNKPEIKLHDGDVILVAEKNCEVAVRGLIKQEGLYELKNTANESTGASLVKMVSPSSKVSHVSIASIKNNVPVHYYLTLDKFNSYTLNNGDLIDFVADVRGETIIAKVSGSISGQSRFPINKNTTLRQVLSFIEVDPLLADVKNVYLKRRSVAEQQRVTIANSLRRLEQSALTATSSSVDEAQIRVQEETLIQDFVNRASLVKTDGIVVVSRGNVISDIRLEDGDEIIIPQASDVVFISGEVMLPKVVTFDKNMSIDDYLAAAGGVSNRADDKFILVIKANGEVGKVEDLGIKPGDQIMVIPRFDSKNMQLAKDIMQIIYQLAVATKVVVDI